MATRESGTIAVLAEKPSVARDIASVLGATSKRDGHPTAPTDSSLKPSRLEAESRDSVGLHCRKNAPFTLKVTS